MIKANGATKNLKGSLEFRKNNKLPKKRNVILAPYLAQ